MRGLIVTFWAAAAGLIASSGSAAILPIVNGSFESPQTAFATTSAAGWTITGPLDTGVAGVFSNNSTPEGDPAHFSNADGTQLAFIGSQTGNAFTQTLTSNYEPGNTYTLTVGVAKSLSLPPAATDVVRMALLYLDNANSPQTLASVDVANSPGNALSANLLKYFSAQSIPLLEGHPAAGRPIVVSLSTVGNLGGYFDLDNVVVATPEPAIGLTGAAAMLIPLVARRRIKQ